jgi:hypothetical protein
MRRTFARERWLWLALLAATIADAWSYSLLSPGQVAAGELSPLARVFGAGVGASLVTKVVGGVCFLIATWALAKAGAQRRTFVFVLLVVIALSLLGAYSNLVGGI